MQPAFPKASPAKQSRVQRFFATLRAESIRAFELYFEYCGNVAEARARRVPVRQPVRH